MDRQHWTEKDPDRLSHMLGTDLRDTVPPQLYALIAAVVARLEKEDER